VWRTLGQFFFDLLENVITTQVGRSEHFNMGGVETEFAVHDVHTRTMGLLFGRWSRAPDKLIATPIDAAGYVAYHFADVCTELVRYLLEHNAYAWWNADATSAPAQVRALCATWPHLAAMRANLSNRYTWGRVEKIISESEALIINVRQLSFHRLRMSAGVEVILNVSGPTSAKALKGGVGL